MTALVACTLLGGGLSLLRGEESNQARTCRQVSGYRSDLSLPKQDASELEIASAFQKDQVAFGGWITDLNCTGQNKVTGRVIKVLSEARPQEIGALSVVVKYFVRSQADFGPQKQVTSFAELFSDPVVSAFFSTSKVKDWKSKVSSGEVPLESAINTIVTEKVQSQNIDVFQRLLLEAPSLRADSSINETCTYDSKRWENIGFPALDGSSERFIALLTDEVVKKNLEGWIDNLKCSHPEMVGRVVRFFVESKPQELSQLVLVSIGLPSSSSSGVDAEGQADAFVSYFSAAEAQSVFGATAIEKAAERIRAGKSGVRGAFVEVVEPTIETENRDEFLFLANSL